MNLAKLYNKLRQYPTFGLILLPLVAVIVFSLTRSYNSLTQDSFSQHRILAQIAAQTLENKFDGLIHVGLSLADRSDLKKYITEGQWTDAVQVLKNTQEQFDFIDRIILFSSDGILQADTPKLTGVTPLLGQSFADREWYKGVSKNWEPYISSIYKRMPEPRLNVVSAVIPIKLDDKVIGILLLPTITDDFTSWVKKIDIPNGHVYFVDQAGQVVGNPKFPSEGQIADYSSWDIVKKLHQGEQGVTIALNPEGEERFLSYQPLSNYGWGVIISQDPSSAFAIRNQDFVEGIIFYGIFIVYALVLTYIISRLQFNLKQYAKGLEQKVAERTREINEEKLKYEVLAKDLEKFQLAMDNVTDNIIITDQEGTVIYANRAVERVTGYKPKEAIGKKSGSLWKTPMPPEYYQKMWDTIKKQKKVFIGEIKNKRKNGEVYTAAISISPVIDKEGEVKFFVGVERDITKEKELDVAKTEFISIAAHQLRTPVSGLNWLTEALQYDSENLSLKQKTYIRDLSMLSKRLIGLVEDLLNLSRIQLKSSPMTERSRVDVVSFVEEFIKEISLYANSKKHTTIFNKSIVGSSTVEINKKSLYNVLQNLVSNAIEYSPENTAVIINLEKTDNFIKTSISNKGPVIPKDEQSHLFERFYRGESVKKMKVEGTGLGLYIIKTIVEELGGKVGFESGEGRDTTFWFTLPLKSATIDEGKPSN